MEEKLEEKAEVFLGGAWVSVIKERDIEGFEGKWLSFRYPDGNVGLARPEHWREPQ